jgi:hypothetical protein
LASSPTPETQVRLAWAFVVEIPIVKQTAIIGPSMSEVVVIIFPPLPEVSLLAASVRRMAPRLRTRGDSCAKPLRRQDGPRFWVQASSSSDEAHLKTLKLYRDSFKKGLGAAVED